ncbi:MAG: peptide deformylase [bacterium]
MTLLEIIPDSNPLLRKTSRRVRHVDDNLRKLVEDMFETMIDRYGIGLAAIQVGVQKRMFIYQVPKRKTGGYEVCDKKDDPEDSEKAEVPDDSAGNGDSVEAMQAVEIEPGDDGELKPDEWEELGGADESEETGGAEDSDINENAGENFICINPRITYREGAFIDEEGCLSKEGWLAKVERAIKVTFEAYDLNMEKFERTVTGLEARCIQHEIDHLDGILFTDRALPDTLRYAAEDEDEGEEGESDDTAEKSDSTAGVGKNDDLVLRKEKTVGVGDN